MRNEAPMYWQSMVSTDLITKGAKKISFLQEEEGTLFWQEMRPEEKGRQQIISYREGEKKDLLEDGLSARTKIYEYGGRSYLAAFR